MRHWDMQELTALACGLTEEQWETMLNENREDELDELVYAKFDVDIEQFAGIAEALLLFTPKVQTGVSQAIINAFVTDNRVILKNK